MTRNTKARRSSRGEPSGSGTSVCDYVTATGERNAATIVSDGSGQMSSQPDFEVMYLESDGIRYRVTFFLRAPQTEWVAQR